MPSSLSNYASVVGYGTNHSRGCLVRLASPHRRDPRPTLLADRARRDRPHLVRPWRPDSRDPEPVLRPDDADGTVQPCRLADLGAAHRPRRSDIPGAGPGPSSGRRCAAPTRVGLASVGAFLAIGCPICNKVVVALLGVSGALSVFAPIQPIIGAASIALLAGSLAWRLRDRALSAALAARRGRRKRPESVALAASTARLLAHVEDQHQSAAALLLDVVVRRVVVDVAMEQPLAGLASRPDDVVALARGRR